MKLYMFQTVPLSIIRSFSLYTQQWYMSENLYGIYHCCVYSEKLLMMERGTFPKHVEFHSKNKFEKSVHLVGFAPAHKLSADLYDIYHCCVYSEKLLMMERGTVLNM